MNNPFSRLLFAETAFARESLGLFRIFFCFIYLWLRLTRGIFSFPEDLWKPVEVLKWLQQTTPPSDVFIIYLHGVVIFCIVVTLLGVFTQLSTLLLFLAGSMLSVIRHSYLPHPHDAYFMEIYLPFFMIFSRWGDSYSVDSWLAKRRAGPLNMLPSEHWRYTWTQHALLLLIAVLFICSAYVKIRNGNFLGNPNHMSEIFFYQSIRTPILGFPPHDLAYQLSRYPYVSFALQMLALLFEATFWLALLNKRLRTLYLFLAVGFHIFNGLLLNIFFTQMIPVYAIFVPWYRWKHVVVLALSSVMPIALISLFFIEIETLYWVTEIVSWYVLTGLILSYGVWRLIKFLQVPKRELLTPFK